MKAARFLALLMAAVWLVAGTSAGAAEQRKDPAKARKKLDDDYIPFTAEKFLGYVFGGDRKMVELFIEAGIPVDSTDDQGRAALHRAAGDEDGKLLPILIKAGANVNLGDKDGTTPLCIAADNGVLKNVQALLLAKADVNAACGVDKVTALHEAAAKGSVPVIQALLAAGASIEARQRSAETPLFYAVHRDASGAAMAALITAGADVNAKSRAETPLHEAVNGRSVLHVNALLKAGALVDAKNMRGETPLFEAARNDSVEIVPILLQAGADPAAKDSSGVTPLKIAEQVHAARVIPLLKDAKKLAVAPVQPTAATRPSGAASGAATAPAGDPKQELQRKGFTLDAKTFFGRVAAGDAPTVSLLLKAGFAPGTRNETGRTALWEAIELKSAETVKALLDGGADANDGGRDNRVLQGTALESGATTVMQAVDMGDLEVLKLLLAAKGDPTKANQYGIGPLMSAEMQNKADVVDLLIQAGANVNAVDKSGTPVLYGSVQADNVAMFKAMLKAGAKVGTKRKLLLDSAKDPEIKKLLQTAP
jgi:ankyrin repeat protein